MFRYLLAALLCAALPATAAETIVCRVVGISDGDTFTCLTTDKQQVKVRMGEIDTPEKAQPYGTRARQALSDLIFGKDVTLNVQDRDRYGRTVARVTVGTVDVNAEMVRSGAAWVYRDYLKDRTLLDLEVTAKHFKRGLWSLPQSEQQAPWDWRKERRKGGSTQQAAALAAAPVQPAGAFNCNVIKSCKMMSGCAEARFQLRQCGNPRIDGDGDGVPCEAICR
ncbi:thermonuclease family protein [Stutzerimonas zhaodongensis]|uniref:thermonuclease family protein n=1 Tax=Stutzerimonas TaxID=2901164 RepID=UPI0038909A11